MKGSRWVGPGLGVACLVIFLLAPSLEPLTPPGMKVAGIFLFIFILILAGDRWIPQLDVHRTSGSQRRYDSEGGVC